MAATRNRLRVGEVVYFFPRPMLASTVYKTSSPAKSRRTGYSTRPRYSKRQAHAKANSLSRMFLKKSHRIMSRICLIR